MDNLKGGIISLIKSALTKEKAVLPEDFDWETCFKIALFHKITALIYYGAYNSGIKIPDEFSSGLLKNVLTMVQFSEQQGYNFGKLFDAFEENNISYMPLKGMILRDIYPKAEMRHMGDADILIKTEEYDKIKQVMKDNGYEFVLESNHEYIWKKGHMQTELHKYLIPSYNDDYFGYYGTGWKLAQKTETSRYVMSDEDFYIYLFTHLAKHYRDAGIGIKHFTDLWLYKKAKKGLDFDYINKELEKLQLLKFHNNVEIMLKVWFENEETDDVSEFITHWIFTSGVYGTTEKGDLSMAIRKTDDWEHKGNMQAVFYIKKILPPFKTMKERYAVLEKVPFLLPVMWIVRIFESVFFKRDNIKSSAKRLKNMSNDNVEKYQRDLDFVGLKFDFKEKAE